MDWLQSDIYVLLRVAIYRLHNLSTLSVDRHGTGSECNRNIAHIIYAS